VKSLHTTAKIGVVVEGRAELESFGRLFNHVRVLCCEGIGGEMTPRGVALRVRGKVETFWGKAEIQKVVVCIDRERRECCAPGFAAEVQKELTAIIEQRQRRRLELVVVVADRAFEAWILADVQNLFAQKLLKKAPKLRSYEGNLGKEERLGKAELEELLGGDYSETRDGPRLFARINLAEARRYGKGCYGSRSLDKFLRELGR
jgi:hypothetical protein